MSTNRRFRVIPVIIALACMVVGLPSAAWTQRQNPAGQLGKRCKLRTVDMLEAVLP